MTDSDSTSIENGAVSSVDYRQVGLVVLAALSLILTAFVASPVADSGSGLNNGGGNGGLGNSSDLDGSAPSDFSFDPPDFSFDWGELFDWMNGDNDSTPRESNERTVERCSIHLVGDLVPGTRVVVVVRYEGRPLSDAPVWFNDRRIGRTDEKGQVVGKVPYSEALRVRVGVPSDRDCEFVKKEMRSSTVFAGTNRRENLAVAEPALQTDSDETQSNVTIEYEVKGAVDLAIEGKPYPGETVTLEATIEGVPMRQAIVEVDGHPVGRTNDNGRATIRVPNDGSERFEVRVSRGDFTGTATVDVLLLDVALRSEGLVVVPGTTTVVEARLGGQPVEGAVVTVNGERRGMTGPDGTLAVELPLDPTATVTVSTDDQTASTSVAAMYRIVVLLLTLVVAALTAVAYRARGVRGAVAILATVGVGLAVIIADAIWGQTGRLAAVIAVIVVIAVVLAQRRNKAGIATTGSLLAKTIERIVAAALLIVRKLERAIVWTSGLVERIRWWLRSLPGSVSELIDRLDAGIRSFPERVLAVRGRIPPVTMAVVAVCIVALVAGYTVAENRGVAVVLAALILGVVTRWYLGRDDSESDMMTGNDPTEPLSSELTMGDGPNETTERPSFRELWRAFARQIDPLQWRTRAPSEIARSAISQDYPDEPVLELTTLFCEVEYGGRSCSKSVRERAEDAYGTIEANPPTDTDGEES